MPELSIITINLNNAKGLDATIKSVAGQSDRNFEFIVIDGGSTDGSVEIIKKHESDITSWISEKDAGIYNAMNKGIRKATGNYLLFLNSGDWLHDKDVVKKIKPGLRNYDVISGDIEIHDAGKWHSMRSEEKISIGYFLRISLYHQATFIARLLFERYGLYNEEFRIGGDYEFFIRTLLNKGATYHHEKIVISNYVAEGISNNEKWLAVNIREKEKAWQLNFSDKVIRELKDYNELLSSKELRWGRRINKYLLFSKNRV